MNCAVCTCKPEFGKGVDMDTDVFFPLTMNRTDIIGT